MMTCAGWTLATIGAVPAFASDAGPLHTALGAPDALTIRGDIRLRTEVIDGQFRPKNGDSDQLVSLRSTIFAEYDTGPLRIGGEFRDVRGYGQTAISSAGTSEINTFEPMQVYVGLDLEGVGGADAAGLLKLGRFTLEDGAGRLIVRPDFANSVNTFTGAVLDWESADADRLLMFWTMPSTRLPNDPAGLRDNVVVLDRARDALQFFGGSFTKSELVQGMSVETYIFRLTERDSEDQPTRDRHLLTYGVRMFREPSPGAFDFEIEADRQTGRARASSAASDIADLPVEAYLFHAEVGRRAAGSLSPRLSLHADYVTGENEDPGIITRFDPLYGGCRVDFGPTGLYGPVARANVISGGVRLEIAPRKGVDAFVMTRAFWLENATDTGPGGVRDRAGQSGTYAGSQVEFRARTWLVPKRFRLEAGGAYLAKGAFLRNAPNAPQNGDSRYIYFDLAAHF